MPSLPPAPLAQPVETLAGVGVERAAQFARLGIQTVEELLLHRPRRHEDRRRLVAIAEARLHEAIAMRGRIVAQGVKRWGRRKSQFEFVLEDGTGRLHCRWWNQPYLKDRFQVGEEIVVFGKLVGLKPRSVDHPETERLEGGDDASIHMNRIVPVYPLTEGMSQRWLRGLMWRTLRDYGPQASGPWPGIALPDLPPHAEALRQLHFPAETGEADAARRRLALEEFLTLQAGLQRRRRNLDTRAQALPCGGNNRLMRPFLARLGFPLTDAQTRVLRELRGDLAGGRPMRRLLQGDVGAGKTVVAACCALMTLESGYEVVLMAPTEILAEQHYRTFANWFGPLRISVELLTGSVRSERPALAAARLVLHIGTHALLEGTFAPQNLGLVIIDEQHKFGVAQREQLLRKGRYPHLLVMTATPIPRTLGLTFYGDLDLSIIDALPPGRGRLRTFVRGPGDLPKVYEFIRAKVSEGRQAFVVFPRLEEADTKRGLKAVTAEFARLQQGLAPHRVGLMHGRLSAEEKERSMAEFRANQTQVLLATSVVEVGLDVANATIMLVENAETFGLAQLHQLRGRIGRGQHDAYCILAAAARTPEARQRLEVLAETNDGFRIAEADLQLRGPGELLGQQQSGLPALRFGSFASDLPLIERARALAKQIVAAE